MNNFYRYIIENYKEIDIKKENIIFKWGHYDKSRVFR